MSEFTTPLRGHWIYNEKGKEVYRLDEPFVYFVGELGSDDMISVPTGFTTDFASVPRPLWAIIPPYGVHGKAAVVHDYLYQRQNRTRKESDLIFKEAMIVSGVKKWKYDNMYAQLRTWGWVAWNNHRKRLKMS